MSVPLVTHIEWATTNLPAAQTFLTGLFGWQFQPFADGYVTYNPPTGPSIAIMHNPAGQAGGSPNVYVSVASIDACLQRAQALGGGIAVPKTTIPDMGSFAFLKMPDGNLIGLHETV